MKILEVCTSQALGGLELYFLKCCNQLSEPDAKVMAFVQDQSLIQKNLSTRVESRSIQSKSLTEKIRTLNDCIKEFQPDIIHSHVKTDLPAIAFCKLLNRSRFKHVHTRQMNMPRKKKNIFHSFIYGKIDLLITITERLRKQVLENVSIQPEKVKVLYYGVPRVSSKPLQIPEITNDINFRIGLIARIDPGKNQHILLEALRILNEKNLTATAWLIGKSTDDAYADKLNRLISQFELSGQVHLMGFQKDPIRLMPNFDVILLTSAEETFGLVLAEAMRAGVAVIGAGGGGVPEIIEHEKTGLLFKPNDPESLAHELEKAMKDKNLLHALAKAGKKSADEKFDEEKHFQKLRQLFLELAHP